VPLTAAQAALEAHHRRIATTLAARGRDRRLTPAEQRKMQAALLKARQACSAAKVCDPKSDESRSPKLDELVALAREVAAQGGSKMLVFSEWTTMLELAASELDAAGIGFVLLHGGVPTAKRPALLERFASAPEIVVLLSTDAGGVGLNLQAASYVVHLELPWNPARTDQRTARAHRVGQTRGVSVTHLCAESGIERDIERVLAHKRAVRRAALDASSGLDELLLPSKAETEGEASAAAGPAPPPPRASMDRARQRMRLAHVVLDAGYVADALAAAEDALEASKAWLVENDELAHEIDELLSLVRDIDPESDADRARTAIAEAAACVERADQLAVEVSR
jgi:superfamily II DNA/RNA helicase